MAPRYARNHVNTRPCPAPGADLEAKYPNIDAPAQIDRAPLARREYNKAFPKLSPQKYMHRKTKTGLALVPRGGKTKNGKLCHGEISGISPWLSYLIGESEHYYFIREADW